MYLNGGRDRDRTDDLLVANEALSQLSYTPKKLFCFLSAGTSKNIFIIAYPEIKIKLFSWYFMSCIVCTTCTAST